jgi:hypothetical protein
MKKIDFIKIGKQFLDLLPNYTINGDLIFTLTEHRVLRGFCFEGSAFNKETFFVNFFIMPLALPTQTLYFNCGNRLRDCQGADAWSTNQKDLIEELRNAVKNQAIPWFSTFDSPRETIFFIKKWVSESKNFRTWETGAALLASYADIEGALAFIDRCLEVCDLSILWHRDIAEQLKELKKACLDNPLALETLLDYWTKETLITLKLTA